MQEGLEESGSSAVIILHPGSSTLHLAFSTDHTPHSLPHLIAYTRPPDTRPHPPDAKPRPTDDRPHPPDPSLVLQYEVEITVSKNFMDETIPCIVAMFHFRIALNLQMVSIIAMELTPTRVM